MGRTFLIGLSFLIGLVPIRTINRPLIGLIVHIISQHIAGLYHICIQLQLQQKGEEEAASSSGLLGLELEGREEGV
jgi:hypothetical protein